MADSNLEEFIEARDSIVDRYQNGRWDRETTIDALRYVHRKYVVGVDEEHLARDLRDYRDIEYCPFCGSNSVENYGWMPQDDGPKERLFTCDCCGGFDLSGELTGKKRAAPDILERATSDADEYTGGV